MLCSSHSSLTGRCSRRWSRRILSFSSGLKRRRCRLVMLLFLGGGKVAYLIPPFGTFRLKQNMTMPANVDDIIKRLSPARHRAVEARAAKLIAKEKNGRNAAALHNVTAVPHVEFSLASWSAAVSRRFWIVGSLLCGINPADHRAKL